MLRKRVAFHKIYHFPTEDAYLQACEFSAKMTKECISEIVTQFKGVTFCIGLAGSIANKTNHLLSDLDFLIVVKNFLSSIYVPAISFKIESIIGKKKPVDDHWKSTPFYFNRTLSALQSEIMIPDNGIFRNNFFSAVFMGNNYFSAEIENIRDNWKEQPYERDKIYNWNRQTFETVLRWERNHRKKGYQINKITAFTTLLIVLQKMWPRLSTEEEYFFKQSIRILNYYTQQIKPFHHHEIITRSEWLKFEKSFFELKGSYDFLMKIRELNSDFLHRYYDITLQV